MQPYPLGLAGVDAEVFPTLLAAIRRRATSRKRRSSPRSSAAPAPPGRWRWTGPAVSTSGSRAAPGLVIPQRVKTLFVEPDEEVVERLAVRE